MSRLVRQQSIRARVVLAAAVASALAGLSVAIVGIALDRTLSHTREETRLREAASTMAAEMTAPPADPVWIAADETRELAGTGIVVAFFDGPTRVAGDPTLRRIEPGACDVHDDVRACGVAIGRLVSVAGRDTDLGDEQRSTMGLALAIAVAIATALSAIGGWLVAQWSLEPLLRLTAEVANIDVERPSVLSGPERGTTEVDALRDVITQTVARLGVALDHARRFAGDAAHELRTPLTTLSGELELIAEKLHEADDVDSIRRARRTVERLTLLVERLLVLARRDHARGEERVEVVDVIEDLVAGLPTPSRARVVIEPSSRPALMGDGSLIGAMVSAGVENALKFSSGTVTIRAVLDAAQVQIEIDDEGPGIPAADRERVFASFTRGTSPGAAGHGIGLALVAHVAALHRGSARFVDGAKGARLQIRIPVGAH